MKVIKFGGSSIGTVERFNKVIKIVSKKQEKEKIIVVLSAIGGITDRLINAVDLARAGKKEYRDVFEEIGLVHYMFLDKLVSKWKQAHARLVISTILSQLDEKLRGVFLLKECSPRTSDSIISTGEYLSKSILAAALNSGGITAESLDAADFIKTDSNFGEAEVDFNTTNELIKTKFEGIKQGVIPVVNGFAGSNSAGEITTLGRSGSDYTATIIAGALNADAVEIWTDVDGVLSADPKIVPEASTLSELSYEEASELAYLGAKVIFPKAMAPVENAGIPIIVLNTFQPEHPGTFIGKTFDDGGGGVKAVTYLQELSLVCLNEISAEYNLIVISRLFALLARLELPVILLNQSASNQSICFVTLSKQISVLLNEIKKEFKLELETGRAGRITFRNDVTVVSAVGKRFDSHSALLRLVFETLDNNGIKSLMFLNSSTHKNVSFVIERPDAKRTVAALHGAFFQNYAPVNEEHIKEEKEGI